MDRKTFRLAPKILVVGMATFIGFQDLFSNADFALSYDSDCVSRIAPNQNLANCDFQNALLPSKDFSYSNLTNTNFKRANLNSANFSGADMRGTNMFGAFTTRVNLKGANLSSVDLTYTNIGVSVRSGNIIGDPVLPDGWGVINGFLVGKYVDLKEENLAGVNFKGVNMLGADLSFSNLESANFESVNLSGVNMCGANLRGVSSKNVSLDGSLNSCQDWKHIGGYLLGAEANLSGANLQGLNLSGMNLSGVNFSLANLSGTNLENTDLSDSNLSGADFTGANLSGAVLSNAVITGFKASSIVGVPSKLPFGTALKNGTIAMELISTPSPTISGVARTGEQLTANLGQWEEGVVANVQWLRDGQPIANASSARYLLTARDLGREISVQVTGNKTGYVNAVRSSQSVTSKSGKIPASAPRIIGSFKVGGVLKATVKAGVPGAKVRYQWLLGGKPIKKANASSFRLLVGHRGQKISLSTVQELTGYLDAKSISPSRRVG